jgi:hypothetical protein
MDKEKEAEILNLFSLEHLTERQVAQRLGISQQWVSKILKRNGKNPTKKALVVSGGMVPKNLKSFRSQLWRYHGLAFTIRPYYFFPRYLKLLAQRGGWFTHRDWIVKLHKESVELRLRRGFDFIDQDRYTAIEKAEESLNRTLFEISNSCGFRYSKEGRISVRLDKQHLAHTNAPTARAHKGEYLQVKGQDGKVWLLIDRSKGINELEFIHSDSAIDDAAIITAFENDLKANPTLKLSTIAAAVIKSGDMMEALTTQIRLHLKVMANMDKTLKEIRDGLKPKDK